MKTAGSGDVFTASVDDHDVDGGVEGSGDEVDGDDDVS